MTSRIGAALLIFLALVGGANALGGAQSAALLPRHGTTFYLSGGSNSSSGLDPAHGWADCTKPNGYKFYANDVIAGKGGATFSCGLALSAASNTHWPISIVPYGSGQPTFSSGNSAAGLSLTNIPGAKIKNAIFTGGGNGTNTTAGISIVNSQAGNTKLAGPTISGVTVSAYGANCYEVKGTNGTSGFSGIVFSGTNVFHDCTGTLANTGTSGSSCVNIFSEAGYGTNNVHQNVVVNGTVQIYNCTGKASVAHWVGSGFTVSETSGLTVGPNGSFLIHDFAGNNTSGSDAVGLWAYDSTNIHYQFFEVYNGLHGVGGNGADGVDLDGGMTNSSISDGKIHDNTGFGVLVDSYNDAIVTTWNNNSVSFILSQNNTKGEFQIGASSTMTNLQAYRLTLFSALNAPVIGQAGGAVTVTGNIANNILWQGVAAANVITLPNPSSLLLTGNDYFGSTHFSYSGTGYTTYAAWQAATGQEKISGSNVGLTSNPNEYVPGGLFTSGGYLPAQDMANNLQAGSPMIGGGILLSQFSIALPATDYYGAVVASNSQTVGAAEGDFTTFAASCTATSTFLARVSSFTKFDNVVYNSNICGKVASGDWPKLSASYILSAPNHTAALLDLTGNHNLTEHGTCTFTARQGITGDALTCFEDTGFVPPDSNYTQNAATIAVYNLSQTSNTAYADLGNQSTNMYNEITPKGGGAMLGTFVAINEGGAFNGFNIGQGTNNTKGMLAAQRTGATTAVGYYNGALSGSGTTEASGDFTAANSFYLLAFNGAPANSFSGDTISTAEIGGLISVPNVSLIDNATNRAYGINTY